MAEKLAEILSGIPVELVTFIIGMTPVAELRGAIPWATCVAGMPWEQAVFWALLGNTIPILPLLLLLGPVSNFLRKNSTFDRFFDWLFERTRRKSSRMMDKYEALGLFFLVGIPLPGTGV